MNNTIMKWYFKPIYNPTNRLIQLSKPKISNIFNTYTNFFNYFDEHHLKTIALTVKNLNYSNISTALNMFAENKCLKKCRKDRQKEKRVKSTRKCLQTQKKYLETALENFFENKKPYLMCSTQNVLNPLSVMTIEQFSQLKDILLKILANYSDTSDDFTIELANKISIWICYMMLQSRYNISKFSSKPTKISNEALSIPSIDLLPIDHYLNYSAEKINFNVERKNSTSENLHTTISSEEHTVNGNNQFSKEDEVDKSPELIVEEEETTVQPLVDNQSEDIPEAADINENE